MNFLAHLFLSRQNEDWMVGNMIADFITNKELNNFSDGIREGIFVHRYIDAFTDNHAAVKQSAHRVRYAFQKYAPVVTDIYYDYLLIANWELYSTDSFKSFTSYSYEVLSKQMNNMPPVLQERLPRMIEADWLTHYGHQTGLQYTFDRFAKRTTFEVDLSNAAQVLLNHIDDFNTDFNAFFPDIIHYIDNVLTPSLQQVKD